MGDHLNSIFAYASPRRLSISEYHLHMGPCNVLETEWLGFAGTSDFQHVITEAIALARQHGATGWVADDRHIGPVRPKNMKWVATHLLPALVELGISRFALLESAETMNRFLIGSMYQEALAELPLEFRKFTDVEVARNWACAQSAD